MRDELGGWGELMDEPQEVKREANNRRALDWLIAFSLGAACSLSAVLIALNITGV
jgi:hypothetical protein